MGYASLSSSTYICGYAGGVADRPRATCAPDRVDAARQSGFAAAFEVSEQDAPTVVVLSARKLRFANLRGAFTLAEVDNLLQGVGTGRVSTQMIQ
eukprot:4470145-Pyramimonas_sp.AAC.1